jgi:hypothetical protein
LDARLCPGLLHSGERLPDLRTFCNRFFDQGGESFVPKAGPPLIVRLGRNATGSKVYRKVLCQFRGIELRRGTSGQKAHARQYQQVFAIQK